MMKIIVAGSKGMLAQDLIPLLKKEHETLSFDQDEVDITDQERVLDLIGSTKPDLVINCAAYNQVDQAETDWNAAFDVNADGVQHLALACEEFGSVLCHFSTDYVFDGKSTQPYQPHDQPNPISLYGESKWAGEVVVQSILKRYYLIRTSSLYGKHGPNFVYTVLRLAQEKDVIRVVEDQIMAPTWTMNLAQGVMQLIHSDNFGVYHLTDRTEGGISWFEFAKEILKLKGINKEIEPTTSEEFKRPAKRPAYSVLDTTLFTQRTG
ncbi:MAG: dTDP-4-dehydrorhamnose reductase, partial [Desulfobacteria bacterium]